MGREIRKVPKDWEHPTDENGSYISMYDQEYEAVYTEWMKNRDLWEKGKHPDQKDKDMKKYKQYQEWAGDPPDNESYRPKYESKPTHYQIYETVSEGTPFSPVFKTKKEMVSWLITQGYSKKAACCFAKEGWAPSMTFLPSKGLKRDIHAMEDLCDNKDK